MENDIFFWKLIEQSKAYDTQKAKCDFLIQQLSDLSKNATVYFEYYLRKKIKGLFKADFLNVIKLMYVMPVGEDFIRFAGWVIAQGKDFYEKICTNPDAISEKIASETSIFDFSFEAITEVADDSYYLSLDCIEQEELNTYIVPSDFGELLFSYHSLPFHTLENIILDNEEELSKHYPRTSAALAMFKAAA